MTSRKPEAQSLPGNRLSFIDTLRGAACCWVMLHHSLEFHPVDRGLVHMPLIFMVMLANLGWLGVSLFLVLSGFCLYYPLVRKSEVQNIKLNINTFAERRAWRILPTYYAAIIAYVIQNIYRQHSSSHFTMHLAFINFKDILIHAFMLHNLRAKTFASIDAAFWSIALESQLYIVFPFLVLLASRRKMSAVILFTFIISISWQFWVYLHQGLSLHWTTQLATAYHALPGRCFEFAVGMVVASLVARPRRRMYRTAAIIFCILLLPGVWYATMISRFGPLLDQIWGILFGCILIMLSRAPSHYFDKNIVLRSVTWIGTISYSLYLMHEMVFSHIPLLETNDLTIIVSTVLRIICTIFFCWLFFLGFERPFISHKKPTLIPPT